MRITNNMMVKNTTANINGNKVNVNALNLQMSSQKKIQHPWENPVIAVRSLRLRSTLSEINQYYEKNIPDAQAWLEATETAIKNMNKILTDVKTECVNGTNSYLTADDRNTILKNLTALKTQLYSEGNADNAGRKIFTGYKTNSNLTFMKDEPDTVYRISQKFSYKDLEEHAYYSGSVEVPTTVTDVEKTNLIPEISKDMNYRIRLPYDDVDRIVGSIKINDKDGNPIGGWTLKNPPYESEEEWEEAVGAKRIEDKYEVRLIKSTGELVFGSGVAELINSGHATIEFNYEKTGFDKGDLRPEYYYNCSDRTDANNTINYTRYDADGNKIYEDIKYTVALNQTLTINLQADELFDMSIYQDVTEMIDAVQAAINAHDKVDRLKQMKDEAQFAGCVEEVEEWLKAAQSEADYADSRLTDLYSAGIGKFDKYMETLNIAYTEIGARGDQLEMTEARISNLQLTQEELKSCNEDKELSDVMIEYTAAFNAYQASLLAAAKIEKQTLLDYI